MGCAREGRTRGTLNRYGLSRVPADRLRLIVITNAAQAAPRDAVRVVEAALRAGAPAVQLRQKGASARDLFMTAARLRKLTLEHGALLFVNDRMDVALASGADGVHLGPDDPTPASVRSAVPEGFLIGYSADDPEAARSAIAAGADYIGCGTVWPTSSKRDAGPAIGLDGLRRMAQAVPAPVVGIGGITPARAAPVRATGASGVAVMGAVMSAVDPGKTVRRLLAAVDGGDRPGAKPAPPPR